MNASTKPLHPLFQDLFHALLILLIGLLTACGSGHDSDAQTPPSEKMPANLGDWLGGPADTGFERAIQPRTFKFPQDHGAHESFKIEWWYVTGNLVSKKPDNEFGYQVTFFRIGLFPEKDSGHPKRTSAWASRNIWMAHVALTDNAAKKHHQHERLSRGAAGLAGVKNKPFKVWLDDWEIFSTNTINRGDFPWKIRINNTDFSLDLTLSSKKAVVLQGDNGLSQKSKESGNASYYYSYTRLNTKGSIVSKGQQYNVTGLSWLDREWSTSALGENQKGWNWFSLQLDDGSELMYYQLIQKNGNTDPFSSGKWVYADGTSRSLNHDTVQLQAIKYWHSKTGKKYAVEWKMTLPGRNQQWRIKALLDDQEMRTRVRYWEGAVRVLDERTGKPLGKGYLEMTGD